MTPDESCEKLSKSEIIQCAGQVNQSGGDTFDMDFIMTKPSVMTCHASSRVASRGDGCTPSVISDRSPGAKSSSAEYARTRLASETPSSCGLAGL